MLRPFYLVSKFFCWYKLCTFMYYMYHVNKGGVHIRLGGGFLTINPLPDGLESWFFGYKGVFGASLSLQDFKAQLCFPGGLPDFFLDSVPVAPNSVPVAPSLSLWLPILSLWLPILSLWLPIFFPCRSSYVWYWEPQGQNIVTLEPVVQSGDTSTVLSLLWRSYLLCNGVFCFVTVLSPQ